MGSLIKHAKKIKKACIGIATGVTVATMMIPPIVLSQMIMMDQEDKCSSEATGSIDVSSDGTVEENKKAIWNYFKASGYSDEATAGIMGNMYAESGFKPGASEIGGAGYGLVQWTTQGYKTALKNYAAQQGKETSDLKLQLDFLCIQQLPTFKWSVRGTTYFKDTEELKKSNSVTKVTEAFMNCFERCNTSYVSCTVERRSQYSMKVYNQFRGQSADADSASTGISGRILWVGDSRTVGMQSAITEGKNKWICSVGKGYNWLVNTAISKVNKELKDTDTIVVNLGVNDLNNYEKYVTKLNSLVDSDWKKAKSIVVMSVNPVDEAKCAGTYVIKNSQIEKFNTYLRKNLRKKIVYVDTYTSLLGNIQTNDGLHYTSTTYKAIYDMIRDTHTGSSADSACESEGSGGILTAEGVMIDFDSKYYTYSADINEGNPNVCAVNKPQWWPYGAACTNQSITGKFNKMICSSYASGRYWDVNYHDSPYPLPTNWDQKLTVDHVAPGSGKYSKDINNPIPKSIVSITSSSGGTMHVAFIEGVDVDGSVVISECNANRNEPKYGFRCQKWKSVKEWAERTLGAGTRLNGFYGK